jgi:hypothetical protein
LVDFFSSFFFFFIAFWLGLKQLRSACGSQRSLFIFAWERSGSLPVEHVRRQFLQKTSFFSVSNFGWELNFGLGLSSSLLLPREK